MKKMQGLGAVVSAVILAGGQPSTLWAANGTWTNLNGGSWTNLGNWAGGVIADGTDNTGDFSTVDITSNLTVTLDGNRTIGNLLFNDINTIKSWTIAQGSPTGVLTLDATAAAPSVFVSNSVAATIAARIAGTNGLTKTGAGTLWLANSNSYSGATIINGGLIHITNRNAVANSSSFAVQPVMGVFKNNTFYLDTGVAISNRTVTLCGIDGNNRAYLEGANNNIWAGDVIISGQDSDNNILADGTFTLAGNITNSVSTNAGVAIRGAGNGTITGNINVSGSLTKFDAGTWTLYGTNSVWTGGTWNRGGTIKAGTNNVFCVTCPLQWYAGDSGYRVMDLNGFDQKVQGLTGYNNGDPSGQVYSATAATLTINTAGSNYTCKCVITGAVSVVKTGLGTQTLIGTNVYTGSTTVTGGMLTNNGALANANVSVAGGTLSGSGSLIFHLSATPDKMTLSSGTLNVSNLNIRFTGTPTLKKYTVVDYSSGLGTFTTSGTTNFFASVTNIPSGYKWLNDTSAKKLYLFTPPLGTALMFR